MAKWRFAYSKRRKRWVNTQVSDWVHREKRKWFSAGGIDCGKELVVQRRYRCSGDIGCVEERLVFRSLEEELIRLGSGSPSSQKRSWLCKGRLV